MMLRNKIEEAEEKLLEADGRVADFFADHVSGGVGDVLHVFSKLADQPQLRTLCGAVIAAGTIAGSDRLVRAGARMMIAHEAATLAKGLLKDEFDRVRPRTASTRRAAKVTKGGHAAKELSSFPSGHSAGAIAVARAYAREFPEHGPAAVAVATLVASLQVPRSAHYPSDVAAGLALGLAAEKLVDLAWNAGEMDRRSEG